MFIKYCVFSKILKYIPDSGLSLSLSRFFLGVYTGLHAWTTKWQVEDQRCSRTGRVKKNHNILRKNTIFNEHPVCYFVRIIYKPKTASLTPFISPSVIFAALCASVVINISYQTHTYTHTHTNTNTHNIIHSTCWPCL